MMAALSSGVTLVLLLLGCAFAAIGLYLVLLSVAALFYRARQPRGAPTSSVTVVIPAHNEAGLIASCVRSLRGQRYPADLFRIVVIADNCADDTAALAAAAGADQVLMRDAPNAKGKGQALRWGLDQILAAEAPPDAVVIVDADSRAAPGLLAGLVGQFEGGAPAVQARYLLSVESGAPTVLTAVAFMLINWVRMAGLTALRIPGLHLAGNGMLLGRQLLMDTPWTAFTSAEDVEYSLMLYMAGGRIAFAGDAAIDALAAPSTAAARSQQLRWHGGKMHLARVWIPRLIRRAARDRRPGLLAVAVNLAVPPLGLLTAAVLGGGVVAAILAATGLVTVWAVVPWIVAMTGIAFAVLIGMYAGRSPAAAYLALARAPLYMLRAAWRAWTVLSFQADTWVRTERGVRRADDV